MWFGWISLRLRGIWGVCASAFGLQIDYHEDVIIGCHDTSIDIAEETGEGLGV
jgi:hypothetical protein